MKINLKELKLCRGKKTELKTKFKTDRIPLTLANLKRYGKWQAKIRFYHTFWHDMADLCFQLRKKQAFKFALNYVSNCKRRNSKAQIPNDKLLKIFLKIITNEIDKS